jgi:hypothetical protein
MKLILNKKNIVDKKERYEKENIELNLEEGGEGDV